MHFQLATLAAVPEIDALRAACTADMHAAGIDQWDDIYPTIDLFHRDATEGNLFILRDDPRDPALPLAAPIIAAAALDQRQDEAYISVPWVHTTGPIGVVHRLMVSPLHKGKGLAKRLMQGLEEIAERRGYYAIRLDAFPKNPAAMRLYAALGYRHAGEIRLRKGLFTCFEKPIPTAIL